MQIVPMPASAEIADQMAELLIAAFAEHWDAWATLPEALDEINMHFRAIVVVDGKALDARRIWNSIVTLYETNREMEPQVERARARLAGRAEEKPADRSPAANGQPK